MSEDKTPSGVFALAPLLPLGFLRAFLYYIWDPLLLVVSPVIKQDFYWRGWYEYCYSSFIFTSICMEYLFPSPHFQSVYVPRSEVGFLWAAYTQFLFLHPFSQSISFKCFTFKVVINMYCHFLNCFEIVFVSLFLLLGFLPRQTPLPFVVRLIWWCWILLGLSVKLFLDPIWMRSLLGKVT